MADYLASVQTAIHQSPNRKRTRDPNTSYRKHATSCKAEVAALVNGSLDDDVESIPVPVPSNSANTAVKPTYSSIQSRKQINGNSSHAASTESSSRFSNDTNTCDSSGVSGNRVQHIVSQGMIGIFGVKILLLKIC